MTAQLSLFPRLRLLLLGTSGRVSTGDSLELSLERSLILIRANLAGRFYEALVLAWLSILRCFDHAKFSQRPSLRSIH